MNNNNTIAITNLNLFKALRLLFKKGKYKILYYDNSTPKLLIDLLNKKYHLQDCSSKVYQEYIESGLKNEKIEKEIFRISYEIASNEVFFNIVEKIANILHIDRKHIKNALVKRFIKELRSDIVFVNILKNEYQDSPKYDFWLDNYEIFKKYYKLQINLIKSNDIKLANMLLIIYLSVWPLIIFKFLYNNFIKKCTNKSNIVLQQKYKKLHGSNAEFLALYRYFKTRDDVIYHCKSRKDTISKKLVSDEKKIFTTGDLKINFTDTLATFSCLIELNYLIIKSELPQKLLFLLYVLSVFKEYVLTKYIIHNYLAHYFMRIRSDLFLEHPITTGVCELLGCYHIGYEHGAPISFNAQYAITDYHLLGVMGKYSMTNIYKEYRENVIWKILGPINAEICYDEIINKDKNKIIAVIADYYIYPWGVQPYESYFNDLFIPIVDYFKFKKNIKIICRFKINKRQGRGQHARQLCDQHGIKCDIEYSADNKNSNGNSSFLFKKSDIVIIGGPSTSFCENLALKKKIIVFPYKFSDHPLCHFKPNLIVRNGVEIIKQLDWLLNVPQEEYNKMIEIIINNLSVDSNGEMVKNFFSVNLNIDKRTELPLTNNYPA